MNLHILGVALFSIGVVSCNLPSNPKYITTAKINKATNNGNLLVWSNKHYTGKIPDELMPVSIPKTKIIPSKKNNIDLSYLGNASLGGLNSLYMGIKGNVPDNHDINFSDNLEKMWDIKLRIKNVTPATKKRSEDILRYYHDNPKITNISTFIDDADREALSGYKSIDFKKLCVRLKIKGDKCAGFKEMSKRIRGHNLIAYGMTELFPSYKGDFNYVMLDTLLRNAGENYIHSIPALGDKYLSVGMYQFTSFAVRHDSKRTEGASIVSIYSSKKISGSVADLREKEHHLAAYYFAVYNIGRLIRKLSKKDTRHLVNSKKCSTLEMTQFIATAHHNPKYSIKNAKRWIKDKCDKKFIIYLGPKLTEYAKKTTSNYKAVRK